MARKRRMKIHEEAILNWHIDHLEPGSRQERLTRILAEEEDFNDLFAVSITTDDTRLLCMTLE